MTGSMRAHRPTGADVARLAGVSAATVSYVLNEKASQSIPETTRRRVHEAADQLGYQPNPAARSLRVGRSDVVLGLLPGVDFSPAYRSAFAELAQALRPQNLALVVHPTPVDSAGMVELWRAITPVCVFAFTSLDPADVSAMRAAGVRVAVACSAGGERQPWELKFGGDDVGRAQAEHLLARGHTRVGVALPVAPAAVAMSVGRRAGVLAAMGAAGQTGLPVAHLPWDPDDATRSLTAWLEEEPEMTGIAAWNDDVGALVLSAAARAGLTVPDQLAVVGAYDFRIATLVNPPLSTVRVDLRTRMTAVARAIEAALAGRPLPTDPVGGAQPIVVPRGSTGSP